MGYVRTSRGATIFDLASDGAPWSGDEDLEAALDVAVGARARRIVLNMASVDAVSDEGVGFLHWAAIKHDGVALRLCQVSGSVANVLAVATPNIRICDAEDDALASF